MNNNFQTGSCNASGFKLFIFFECSADLEVLFIKYSKGCTFISIADNQTLISNA